MRVAALYDIHGNLPALEAVLEEVHAADVDRIVVGGDVVPGPMPRETLACLLDLDLPTEFIQGNGDREVVARMSGVETGTVPEKFRPVIDWVAAQLHPEDERLLGAWPKTLRVGMPEFGDILFCHATPRNDTDIFTRLTPDDALVPVFNAANVPLVVCGHSHMQFDRIIGKTRVVNAGSVGMPFGEPGAYWLLLGPGVQLRRTSYDLTEAANRIRASGYPQADDFAARNVVQPPSEMEMLDVFGRAELRPE
jgi:predicted phosphodiesterase